jgi:ribosomal protein S1
MSWTKRLTHPSELLNLGDEIEVVVLNVNKDKQEISLGLKQTETNPWAIASQKYPQGTIVTATVRSTTNYGAFVEIEPGIDGMIHISDLSWTKKYSHPSEALQKGEQTKCVVLDIDIEKQHISLGVKQMTEDPWKQAIPQKYIPGHIIKGKVTKITNFGAFVELESDLEGLLHISELADHKIDKPQDIVKEGDEIEVKILKVDMEARKIGLSLRRAQWAAEDEAAEAAKQSQPPIGVQTVLSETHTDKLTQAPQGDTQESAPAAEVLQEPKSVETQETDSEKEQTEVKQEVEESAQENDSEQVSEEAIAKEELSQEEQTKEQTEEPKSIETQETGNEEEPTETEQEVKESAQENDSEQVSEEAIAKEELSREEQTKEQTEEPQVQESQTEINDAIDKETKQDENEDLQAEDKNQQSIKTDAKTEDEEKNKTVEDNNPV